MSKLKKNFLAIPAGRIGNVVFKTWKGIPYISLRPASYKIPQDDYYKKRVSCFNFCSGFCSAMNKLDVFRDLWLTAEKPAYSNMMSCNLLKLRRGGTFKDLSLVPGNSSFDFIVKEVRLSETSLTITIEELLNISIHDMWISMQGIMCLEEPIDSNSRSFQFIPLYSGEQGANTGGTAVFNIFLTSSESVTAKNYSSKKILVNLVTRTRNGIAGKFSINVMKTISDELV